MPATDLFDHILAIVEPATADDKEPIQTKATFTTFPTRDQHESFLRRGLDVLLADAIFDGTARDRPVLQWHSPNELRNRFDFKLRNCGSTHEELLALMRAVVKYSVKIGHLYFANQLFSGVDPYGLMGQWMTDALNPSVYTFEVAPVFTLMEDVVLQEMRSIVGFQNGQGDGIFCPGGSIANGYAINCARYKFMPQIKEKGLHGLPRLVLFTSKDAHYSIKKMASFLGIGSDNVYLIETDYRGCMDVQHLVQEINRSQAEGAVPFMVAATAGTTVLGAFDPLSKIADICSKYGLWFHVDAAWGGGALISKKYRILLDGISRADSVTWNPHKMLCAPQQCSTLLLRHENILNNAHSTNALYLFQKDKFYDTSYDVGDKHVQCGRRADVLKFWFMWKAKGTEGLEQHVNKVFENAKYFLELIKKRSNCFRLVLDKPQFTNICFWYIPQSLRGSNVTEWEAFLNFKEQPEWKQLNCVAPILKERMMKEGTMMVSYQTHNNLPNFFRIVFQNSGLEKRDMVKLVEEFERLGHDL